MRKLAKDLGKMKKKCIYMCVCMYIHTQKRNYPQACDMYWLEALPFVVRLDYETHTEE